jgi:hypothetical protein
MQNRRYKRERLHSMLVMVWRLNRPVPNHSHGNIFAHRVFEKKRHESLLLGFS